MSNTVPSQPSAFVFRATHRHLRALLALAIAVILGTTTAIVVSAIRGHTSPAGTVAPAIQSAIPASPTPETGATLDHSERRAAVRQTTDRLANYPDLPPASAWPQPSVSYYVNPPQL
jgi:hypothetical protein